MRYDFELIHELCQELGLRSCIRTHERLEIELGEAVVLCFQNAERDEDCLAGFEGTPSHTHGDFMFVDGRSYYTEMNYLDVLTGLKDGEVLICERWNGGRVSDRWLVHRSYNDEFKYMEEGEEIRIRRPATPDRFPHELA
ncbi:MAG: hypothetical protein JWQ71_1729 [Pedosphaera sp.]|nr:hypothetical protein [Pedosphaera sp.]